jgi:hypothetical protein
MAIIIRDKTKCWLCGQAISTQDDVIAFPAFLGPNHRLNRYSDSVFHRSCFIKCLERKDVESLYLRYREIWESRPKELKSLEEIDAWGREALKEFS